MSALSALSLSAAPRGTSWSPQTRKISFLSKGPVPQVRVHPRTDRHTPTAPDEGECVSKTLPLLPHPRTNARSGGRPRCPAGPYPGRAMGPVFPRSHTAELAPVMPHDRQKGGRCHGNRMSLGPWGRRLSPTPGAVAPDTTRPGAAPHRARP